MYDVMAKTEMIYENLLPHSISEISLLHRKIGVHTSLTFSTKKWTIRKIWCPCLEKPNEQLMHDFLGGKETIYLTTITIALRMS